MRLGRSATSSRVAKQWPANSEWNRGLPDDWESRCGQRGRDEPYRRGRPISGQDELLAMLGEASRRLRDALLAMDVAALAEPTARRGRVRVAADGRVTPSC